MKTDKADKIDKIDSLTERRQGANRRAGGLGRRLIVSVAGLMICGVGVGIFLYSGLGVDPASVFELGLANVFHTGYGTASALLNLFILAIVFFVDRKYINVSSLFAIVGIGYTADFMNYLLRLLMPQNAGGVGRAVMVAVGLFIMGTGIAAYIAADLGVGAVDLISEIISARLHLPYRYVRIAGDVTFVAVGFALGGTVGVGTVAAAFLTGPTVQLMRPFVYRVTDRFLGRERRSKAE